MGLVAMGLIWAGYTSIWLGWARITGPRNGSDISVADAILPSHLSVAEQWLQQPHAGTPNAAAADPNILPIGTIPSGGQKAYADPGPNGALGIAGYPGGTKLSGAFTPGGGTFV